MAAAHNALAAFHGLEIGMLGEKIRDFDAMHSAEPLEYAVPVRS